MVTAKVEIDARESTIDEATEALRAITSPDRKRKERSPERYDRDGDNDRPNSGSRSYGYGSPSPPNLSPEARHQSAHSSHSATASASGAGGSASSSRGNGEESLTLKRREANRLAAQRFRSRKKGYQDSLEERIRILEDEKDVIARRLDQTHQRPMPDDGYYRQTEAYPSHSPDRGPDNDVRFASLESANRRLQDELRGVMEDNDRLRDEVDRWRKWEREQRESRPVPPAAPATHRPPALAPLDFGPMAPPSYTSSSHSSAYPPTHPTHPSHPSHPPLERGHSYTHSYRPSSPGPRLPPLRIPNKPPAHTSPNGRSLLPRPESMERVHTLNQNGHSSHNGHSNHNGHVTHNGRPQSSPGRRI